MRYLSVLVVLLLERIVNTVTNQELPELVKRTYHGVAPGILNVTVGEQFSLPLPLFDSPWNSQNFQVYQLNQ